MGGLRLSATRQFRRTACPLRRSIGAWTSSGKGVLRALNAKYSPVAFEAIISPILTEIGRQAPIKSRRYARDIDPEADPLLATTWPPA